MRRVMFLAALVACGRPAPPIPATEQAAIISTASCGAGCTISQTCRDVFSSCAYCYQGQCSAVLPAEPIDAGVDAPSSPPATPSP